MAKDRSTPDEIEARRSDIRDFFINPDHWIYRSPGTESFITPESVFHITQLEVLFEDRHFHFLTYRALTELRSSGFLANREVTAAGSRSIVVWRKNIRFVERAIQKHIQLLAEYSSEPISKATGDYAETLVLLGLSRLHMNLIGRNVRSYKKKTWTASDHDLDFVMEKDGVGYGVEVKNTFDYIPADELSIKLEMCQYLELRPLFIVRNRHSGQWNQAKDAGGLLYIFKSKIFPPGQEALVKRMWEELRLPVVVWHDWPGQFYNTIREFTRQ